MTLEQLKQTKLYQSLFRKLGNDVDFPDIETALLEAAIVNADFSGNTDDISGAFDWDESTEGYEYWNYIYNRWRQNEYNF